MASPTHAVAAASSDQPHPPACSSPFCSGCRWGATPAQTDTCGSCGRGAKRWKSRKNPVNLLSYQTSFMLEPSVILGATRAMRIAEDPVGCALHCVGFYNMQPINAHRRL